MLDFVAKTITEFIAQAKARRERNSRHSPALAERRKLLVFLDEEYLRQQNRITRRMPNESKVDRLEVVLQQIGSESFEAVRAREKRTFASFAGPK